jgi:hypothetical protein
MWQKLLQQLDKSKATHLRECKSVQLSSGGGLLFAGGVDSELFGQ